MGLNISFYVPQNPLLKWRSHTVLNVGLGGQYPSVYNLAKQLKLLGNNVIVWCHALREDIYDGVIYANVSRYGKLNFKEDVIIGCGGFPYNPKGRPIRWEQRPFSKDVDEILTVVSSEFQASKCKGQTVVIPKGVDNNIFGYNGEEKTKDFVFDAHPIKGFNEIPLLQEKLFDNKVMSKIHVYGNAMIWGWENSKPDMQDSFTGIIKSGAGYHGRLGHRELSVRLKEAKIFIYPSNFDEPFGSSVLEAMSAGAVPVVPNIGNLPSLVGDGGVVIDGTPNSRIGWHTIAVDTMIDLLNNDNREVLSKKAQDIAKTLDWKIVAQKWQKLLS